MSLDPIEGATALSGADRTDSLWRAGSFQDDEGRLLLAMFRMPSPTQEEAVLKTARATKPGATETRTAAEEGEAETDRTERVPAARGK